MTAGDFMRTHHLAPAVTHQVFLTATRAAAQNATTAVIITLMMPATFAVTGAMTPVVSQMSKCAATQATFTATPAFMGQMAVT